MPTKSYQWKTVDFASAKVIDDLLNAARIGNREFDRLTDSAINYGRLRDIRKGLKAPVRLSEYLLICDVCHADPVETLREIMREAERIEHERLKPVPISSVPDEEDTDSERPRDSDGGVDAVAQREQEKLEQTRRFLRQGVGVAALHDEHKYEHEDDQTA